MTPPEGLSMTMFDSRTGSAADAGLALTQGLDLRVLGILSSGVPMRRLPEVTVPLRPGCVSARGAEEMSQSTRFLEAMRQEHLLIISAVRNEARYIELVVNAMKAQTRPPDEWIVVDDGSTDGTLEMLEQAAREIPFMRVLKAPAFDLPSGADRLCHASEARAFNYGLRFGSEFTHVGKLDGDIELPPDYYEQILWKFREDSQLGSQAAC